MYWHGSERDIAAVFRRIIAATEKHGVTCDVKVGEPRRGAALLRHGDMDYAVYEFVKTDGKRQMVSYTVESAPVNSADFEYVGFFYDCVEVLNVVLDD